MPRTVPYPSDLFAPDRRHLFVLAHQDDELPYAGIVQRTQRAGGRFDIVWMTNGDGLAEEAGETLARYAAMRRSETDAAMAVLGADPSQLTFLDHSEVAIYDAFARMVTDGTAGVVAVWPLILEIAAQIERAVRDAHPDVVWTLAYQGGHPEHDLVHLLTQRALRKRAAETGRETPLYELPAYELVILIPLRFKPWMGGEQHAIALEPVELERKLQMAECYPSQASLLQSFRHLMRVYHRLARPLGHEDGAIAYLSRETFRRVPPDHDYTRSTYPFPLEFLNYPIERHRGVPIRWKRTLHPIARMLRDA